MVMVLRPIEFNLIYWKAFSKYFFTYSFVVVPIMSLNYLFKWDILL